jgi:glutamate/tyrosine decarboxylase-like PLP-dependent enzyme
MMEIPRDAHSQAFVKARSTMAHFGRSADVPRLDTDGSRAVEAWFLGPKGENVDEFERLVVEAIRDQAYWRRNYHPGDPTHITEQIKRSPAYLEAMEALQEGYQGLLAWLKKSVPFFSMRYQGHMNWDLTIPGMLGYFAAMLYNPNNVAFEGSTATTILELLVGDDLCQMLGYRIPTPQEVETGATRPWGHITCDGTVANIEAIWSARNLRLYPVAVREALAAGGPLIAASKLEIPLPAGGSAPLVNLSAWELLNLPQDLVLSLPQRLNKEFGIASNVFANAVEKYSLQNLGIWNFARRFLGDITHDPVVLVSGTKHYSFPKAAALLGLGSDNLVNVSVDLDARMDMADLRRRLQKCLDEQRPVIAVVAVIGTTEESALDPLTDVVALREEFAKKGLTFHVHADGAWGGYHRAVINEPFHLPEPRAFAGFQPQQPPIAAPLSRYAQQQLAALPLADSITVDPHKSGYIPYPAGALCYRNGSMRHLVTFSAPVVFHGEAEPTVGIYGIEGSKPGAAAAAVYLSHRVIRPTRDGYGKIIGQALFSCRKLYARLLTMARPTDPFIVVPVPRQPAERAGRSEADISAEKQKILELIDQRDSSDIRGDEAAMHLLGEIGPDENILSYAFNLKLPDGTINADLFVTNALNKAIYDRLSIDPGHDIYGYDLIVSTTDFDEAAYGSAFIQAFKKRLGVDGSPEKVITVLRSVVMDPWVTETPAGTFIDVLEREFRKAVLAAVHEVCPPQMKGY